MMLEEGRKPKAVHMKKCAVAHALEIIGGKWRLPIIWELSAQDSMRYNELKRHLGSITNIMLTRALQALEENGLVRAHGVLSDTAPCGILINRQL